MAWRAGDRIAFNKELTAAAPDGGAAAQNAAGDIGYFDGTGQLLRTIPAIGLRNPVEYFGGLIGASGGPNTLSGLTKVEGTFEDVTYFSVRYAPQLWAETEQYGFGNPQGQTADAECRSGPPISPTLTGWAFGRTIYYKITDEGNWTQEQKDGLKDAFEAWGTVNQQNGFGVTFEKATIQRGSSSSIRGRLQSRTRGQKVE